MVTTKYTAHRRQVQSSRNLPKSLSDNSEPQFTAKLVTVCQIVQLCTHVLGVEQNFNMLVSKIFKLSSVDRARAIGHLEAG